MNQFSRSKGTAPGTCLSSPARDPRRSISSNATVEYDDGDPATVAVAANRPETAALQRFAASRTPGTPLASVPRVATIDYDDGDPATIVC